MKKYFLQLKQRYSYSLILLKRLVITDFKLRYKGSVLGYVWTLLKPLALFAVMYVVFVHFLKFGADIPHFTVYLLLGIVLWNYFVEVTMNGMSAIVGKGDLMRKLFFPRYVVVVAGSFSALINLIINLFVVGLFIVFNGVELTSRAFLIIPVIIELFVFSLAVAFFLGALYVKLRDVNYIWELMLQAGFYATPIFYPMSLVLESSFTAGQLLLMNPLAQMIQDARYAVITDKTVTVWSLVPQYSFVPLLIVFLMTIASIYYFRKKSPTFAEDI